MDDAQRWLNIAEADFKAAMELGDPTLIGEADRTLRAAWKYYVAVACARRM